MNSFFSDDMLSLIKDRLSVSEIIRRRVTLKPKGKDFLGSCPFHNEKTPSFTVNDQKGFYHCFGCGAHGDILSFLTDYEKMTFHEAVEFAAAQAGITLAPLNPLEQKAAAERETMFKLLHDTANLFHEDLKNTSNKAYYDYLKSRSITDQSIIQFKLGVATKSRLTQFITTHNISTELAEKVGLIARYDTTLKERFFDRLMFPIFDERHRVVGFGGRTLSNDIQPKYLNSSENTLFHKGSLLYGLHLIDHKIPTAILAEGYLDVIAAVQAGYKNVFATMGTALTQEQAQKILKYFNKIYMCFDGDSAGFKAMNRAAETFLPLLTPGVEMLFVKLPKDQDPHSILTSNNAASFHHSINAPLQLVDFLIMYEVAQHPGNHPAALALQRKNTLDRITAIQDSFLRSLYKEQIYNAFQRKRTLKHPARQPTLPTTVSSQTIYEMVLLKTFMACPSIYKDFMDQLHTHPLSPNTQKILNAIENYIFLGDTLEFSKIVPYIKQQLPTLTIDHILSDTFHVHAPFLNEPIDENSIRKGIESILDLFNEVTALDAHIKEAQERFKLSQSQTDWDRLKMLRAQKQHRSDTEL